MYGKFENVVTMESIRLYANVCACAFETDPQNKGNILYEHACMLYCIHLHVSECGSAVYVYTCIHLRIRL